MKLLRRPPLPPELEARWAAFSDCLDLISGSRRLLLATLPTGRVEPAPIGVGLDAVEAAISDVDAWMPLWEASELSTEWAQCSDALVRCRAALPAARLVAADTDELDQLLTAVEAVVEPLAVFGRTEVAWRRRWRIPGR